MLLNQCLAISLSPTGSNSELESRVATKNESNLKSSLNFNVKKLAAAESSYADRHSSALIFFQQLVERNCKRNSPEVDTNWASLASEQQDAIEAARSRKSSLNSSLQRVEFAGFVVPSWLLLSGSFSDLHCIKTSWSEGLIEAPAGFKIETIGK